MTPFSQQKTTSGKRALELRSGGMELPDIYEKLMGEGYSDSDLQKAMDVLVFDKDDLQEAKKTLSPSQIIARDAYGKPLRTIENFLLIMRNDPNYSCLRFNSVRGLPEIGEGKKTRLWSDADDAASRNYIEAVYGLHHSEKHRDALEIVFRERSYNPMTDMLDRFVWDGVSRCEVFLPIWMQTEDNAYTREVSRLIFAGAVRRAYDPGCKFDCVPVLIGTKQGEGKSSIIRWLALRDEFYASLQTFNGSKALETISGKLVVEIEELFALAEHGSSNERIKAFLTSQSDTYRRPYDKRQADYLRTCLFIGTGNNDQFLTDKTGNRRWYPVTVHSNGRELRDHESECRKYINQCYAEMVQAYRKGLPLASPVESEAATQIAEKVREDAMIEDPRVGMIERYIRENGKKKVCIKELWDKAMFGDSLSVPQMTRKDSREIGQILTKELNFERSDRTEWFGLYGTQKAYVNKCDKN